MSESKHNEDEYKNCEDAKEDGDNLAALDPIVEAFLEFSYSTSLGECADDFVQDHAKKAGFANKSRYEKNGEGHPLSWSALHSEYCDSIDKELTTFCNDQNVDAKELFEKLEEAIGLNKAVADALPGFVKLTSYEHFCAQMESQATMSMVKEEAEDLGSEGSDDYFSGEWIGLYNFDSASRDSHLKELSVPWVLRKMVSTMMAKEGKVSGVVRYIPGETLQRTFNFGMLGQQNETFVISDEFEDFNGGFGKIFLKTQTQLDADGRGFEVRVRRYDDAAKTKRKVTPSKGLRSVLQSYKLKPGDDDVMVCEERILWEESGEYSKGWSYDMYRVKAGGRK